VSKQRAWNLVSAITFEVRTLPASNKKSTNANSTVELYERLIATIPEIERKGAANPYTALNGNMFTLLHQSARLAIRLPEQKREEFLKKYKSKLFEAYGTVMPEYVAVPDSLLKNTKELRKYLEFSYEYAKTLKVKSTKKKS
jgi:TfoX/Sxy family transcriptional regulator of competence genes